MSIKKIIYPTGFIFLFFKLLIAQPEIFLPTQIQFIVNDNELNLSSGWMDSLIAEVLANEIRYKIVGATCSDRSVTTQIQLPQFLSLNQLFRQVVIYYSMLPEEDDRRKEKLLIYPYFKNEENSPSLECRYNSNGRFEISVFNWERIPPPLPPDKKQLEIFNRILQTSFHNASSFSGISDDLLNEFARANNLPVEQVKEIYQNTILWQLSR